MHMASKRPSSFFDAEGAINGVQGSTRPTADLCVRCPKAVFSASFTLALGYLSGFSLFDLVLL